MRAAGGRSALLRPLVGVLLAAALCAGCSPVATGPTPGGPARPSTGHGPVLGAAAATTAAAELRAGLTALLLQRAHLLALAQDGAPAEGPLGLLAAELVEVAGGPPALAAALQDEQDVVVSGEGDLPGAVEAVAAALLPVTRDLPQEQFADALAALDGPAVDGQAALAPSAAVRSAELLSAALAAARRAATTRTPAAGVRARLTALLVHRSALPPGPARSATDAALAVEVVPSPGGERAAVAAALTASDDARFAAQVAAALPSLPAPVLLADLQDGQRAREALFAAPVAGRALALRAATDSVLGPAALLAAAVAERQRLS